MKKYFSIALSLLLMVSQMGFSMNTHFCGGRPIEKSFNFGLEVLDCGMSSKEMVTCSSSPNNEVQLKKYPCCKNQHQVLKVETKAPLSIPVIEVCPKFLITFFQTFSFGVNIDQKNHFSFIERKPPPSPLEDLQVLFQTFLI